MLFQCTTSNITFLECIACQMNLLRAHWSVTGSSCGIVFLLFPGECPTVSTLSWWWGSKPTAVSNVYPTTMLFWGNSWEVDQSELDLKLYLWLTFIIFLQLRAAIDDFNVNGTQQNHNFEYAGYSKVFNGFVDMHQIIDSNVKHNTKMKALWVAWATLHCRCVQVTTFIALLLIMSPQLDDVQAFCHSIPWWIHSTNRCEMQFWRQELSLNILYEGSCS